jgi:hypothetical protein
MASGAQNPTTSIVTTPMVRVSNLASATNYSWTVRAVCADNQTTEVIAGTGFMTARPLFCNPPIDLKPATEVNSVTVTWIAPPGAQAYEIWYAQRGRLPEYHTTVLTDFVRINNLMGDTEYVIQIRTICAEGVLSSFSGVLNFRTQAGCSYPMNVRVLPGPTTTSATVSWNKAPGVSVNRYIVSFRANRPNAIWTNVNVSPDMTSYGIYSLNPGEEYLVRIRTRCDDYLSLPSPDVAFNNNGQILRGRIAETSAETNDVPTLRVKVFPNPNQGTFTVSLENELSNRAVLSLNDIAGRIVWMSDFDLQEGQNELTVNAGNVPSGVYMLTVDNGLTKQTHKIVGE